MIEKGHNRAHGPYIQQDLGLVIGRLAKGCELTLRQKRIAIFIIPGHGLLFKSIFLKILTPDHQKAMFPFLFTIRKQSGKDN